MWGATSGMRRIWRLGGVLVISQTWNLYADPTFSACFHQCQLESIRWLLYCSNHFSSRTVKICYFEYNTRHMVEWYSITCDRFIIISQYFYFPETLKIVLLKAPNAVFWVYHFNMDADKKRIQSLLRNQLDSRAGQWNPLVLGHISASIW